MATYNGRWTQRPKRQPWRAAAHSADVQSLARSHTVDAVRTLSVLMQDMKTPRCSRARGRLLLDRAWGRPLQSSVSTNLDVRQLSDEELIAIILENQDIPELPAPEPRVGVVDDAA